MSAVAEPKGRWWKILLLTVVWVVPTFWLKDKIGYPTSFGVERCHGRGCYLDDLYHSYLLVERHQLLDIATFLLIWAPFLGVIGWIVFGQLRRLASAADADIGPQR